jgi:2-polyprenyl-6-methoxyphenol hydroxylase-like FAD-dependent oxidoreductase
VKARIFRRKEPAEVLVVGAGPVGLFAALVLAKRGVRVRIVDSQWRTTSRSYACALHADSLARLEEFGLLPEILEEAYRIRSFRLLEGSECKAEMHISELVEDHSFLAVMRQSRFEQLLEKALDDAGVKIDWSYEATGLAPRADGVNVTLDKLSKESGGYAVPHSEWVVSKSKDTEFPFVIGADGHASRVRRALGIEFPEVGEAQDFASFEFKTNTDLGHSMRLVMDEDATSLCWPLPKGFCRWGFQIPRTDTSWDTRGKDRLPVQLGYGPLAAVKEDSLHKLLTERAPWFKGSMDTIYWRTVVRFERRLADSFGSGRVWLAGDAGHITGPAGVQSMNVGLREARDLAETIARILKGQGTMEDLEAYNRQRRAEWRFMLGMEEGLASTSETDPWIAARRERLLPCIPASGQDLAQLAKQLGLEASETAGQTNHPQLAAHDP